MRWGVNERDGHRAGSHPVVCKNGPAESGVHLTLHHSELVDMSKIAIKARPQFNIIRKYEVLVEVTSGEVMGAFWDSKESVSRT